MNILIDPQTKRDEPSNVVDYEKIDEDARVSPNIQIFTKSFLRLWFVKDKRGFLSNSVINKLYLMNVHQSIHFVTCEHFSVCMKPEWRGREPTWGPGSPSWRRGASPTCRKVNCTYNTTRLTSSHTGSHYTSSPDDQSEQSVQYSILTLFMSSAQCPLCSVWLRVILCPVQMFLFFYVHKKCYFMFRTFLYQWQCFFLKKLQITVFHFQYQHLFVLNTKMFNMFNSI